MKRFFALVAASAMVLTGMGTQVWAALCTQSGGSYCQFDTGCFELDNLYSSISSKNCGQLKPDGNYDQNCTCSDILENCTSFGTLYSFPSKPSALNAAPWGNGENCKALGGTYVAGKDPDAPPPVGCCNWSTEGDKCYPAAADEVDNCKSGANVYWEASCGPSLPDDSKTCPSGAPTYNGKDAACSGQWCYWPANETTGGPAGCFQIVSDATQTCAEALSNCETNSPRQKTYSSEAACLADVSAVRLLANAAKTPGLKVSYAKNRVTVNWTPTTKISSGTVQLLNVKGAVLSTAFIKASSGKVTAKLGTVGVPAGMYFVQINAVGVNGQKIVSQSAVSVVK